MDYQYIDSSAQLAEFCGKINNAGYCAIDTEFVREKTYYAVLALIQIASEKHMACIDPLTIDNFDPFIALMQNRELIKVFHSPSQDLEILFQRFSCMPQPIFDTQLAAAVLGYDHQIGYADLVNQITGIKLEKKHTRANWSRRPLAEDEINYAMDDVRYLLPVYQTLKTELDDKKRYAWIEKDLLAMTSASNYQIETADLWRRLKGVQKLRGVELQIARHLCKWREQMAQQINLPRRWVVKDDLIIEIARLKPSKVIDLDSIRDVNEKFIEKHGNRILQIVATAQDTPTSKWPQHDVKQSLSTPQQALGDCLMALCRIIAEDNQIAVATLATRKDIDSLITDRKNSRLSQGWRFSLAGEKLLNFLHGQSALSVSDEQIRLSPLG
ncbi:MAG: ribonuclease D [Gammaproteobacteria bacterium]|nr:MAG: ribonuclease D [Gammaproteobacteria bacterium]